MEQDKDQLAFSMDGAGALQLLETEFYNRLPPALMEDLKKFGSIPAFLSQVTVHLFEQSTHVLNARR